MAKLTRVPAKIFAASAAADEIGQFGSAVAGSKLETADVATIQGLSAWLSGWSEALVSGNRYPALQEMNGLLKVLSYQGAYALQEGIPEYDSATTYYIGSIVKKTGTFELYGSLTDDNVGNALVDGANWKYLGDLSKKYPDFTAGVVKSYNTEYTATEDGYIRFYVEISANESESTTAVIDVSGIIDNTFVFYCKAGSVNNYGNNDFRVQTGNATLISIKSGQKYKLYTNFTEGETNVDFYDLRFYPLKGV